MSKLDTAVLAALSLNPSVTTVTPHGGGGGFAVTLKISTETKDGRKQYFFMKTRKGKNSETMFRGEFESLNSIHNAVPFLCPKAFAQGVLQDDLGYYLVTDFLDLSSRACSSSSSSESIASKIAKLHTSPQPPEYENKFGFPVPTCCGSTVQDNTWEENWANFYGKRRLMQIIAASEINNGSDKELRQWVEKTVCIVVPRLLGGLKDMKPAIVHGDLWSGNASKGRFGEMGEDGREEELIFDPSACYAHNEYEFGIMKMFGGFGSVFFTKYHDLVPKTEPVEEYDDRVELYQLYHQLNHHTLFGSGYRSGAISTMKSLYAKYGEGR